MRTALWTCLLSILLPALVYAQPKQRAELSAVLNVSAFHPGDKGVAAVVLDIAPGYHAQSHTPAGTQYIKLEVKGTDSLPVHLTEAIYPAGKDETYPGLGLLNVYEGKTIIYVPIEVSAEAKPGDVEIAGTITYQICDSKTCYFPQRNKPWSIKTQIVPAGTPTQPASPDLFTNYHPAATSQPAPPTLEKTEPTPPIPATETAFPESDPSAGFQSAWTAFGAAFLAGLLFNIMPCVLPVLPLKAIGFYEVSQHHRAKSIALGLVFSLGLIAVFAILAVLVLVLRVISWGELFSKGWFVWSIVAILVIMALGLFNLFTILLPTSVYNLTPRHDTYTGNFLFGSLTAILATPCTAPLLPIVLLWAASRPGYIGVPAMLMVGVGMASPYMILSAFPELARRFPRAGAGAELFKQMMAWLLLIAAAYFGAGRLIHSPNFWWLVTAFVAVAAFFLMARTVQISKSPGPVAFSSILSVAMLAGSIYWSAQVTGLTHPAAGAAANTTWTPFTTEAFDTARRDHQPILVKFTANWCGSCQYIEGTVFTDPAVWNTLHQKNVVTLKADFTTDNPEAQKLLLALNPTGGIPLTAIYRPAADHPVLLSSVYTTRTLLDLLDTLPQPSK